MSSSAADLYVLLLQGYWIKRTAALVDSSSALLSISMMGNKKIELAVFEQNLTQGTHRKTQKMQKMGLFLSTWRPPRAQKALQHQANPSLWYGCCGTVRTDAVVRTVYDTEKGPFVRHNRCDDCEHCSEAAISSLLMYLTAATWLDLDDFGING